jgi:hypothetical protein
VKGKGVRQKTSSGKYKKKLDDKNAIKPKIGASLTILSKNIYPTSPGDFGKKTELPLPWILSYMPLCCLYLFEKLNRLGYVRLG